MARHDNYFTFPLHTLKGLPGEDMTPLQCLDLAINAGVINAGVGYLKRNGSKKFWDYFRKVPGSHVVSCLDADDEDHTAAHLIVGARLCGVDYHGRKSFGGIIESVERIEPGPVFLKISASSLWAAFDYQRHLLGKCERPEHGLTWDEFRVLCAIASWPLEEQGFCQISEASISVRASGFQNRAAMDSASVIPYHAPKLGRKAVKRILSALETLKMFACFQKSAGLTGGKTYYSFRHSGEGELREAVMRCPKKRVNKDIHQRREADRLRCLKNKTMDKSGTSGRTSQGTSGRTT